MIYIKKLFMKMLLMAEMMIFGYVYFFGVHGIAALQTHKKEVIGLEQTIKKLETDIEQLEKEIYVWQTDDFYKEKIAREQLQMARKGDELFYIGT